MTGAILPAPQTAGLVRSEQKISEGAHARSLTGTTLPLRVSASDCRSSAQPPWGDRARFGHGLAVFRLALCGPS